MEAITLGSLTKAISTKSQLMMKFLEESNLESAYDAAHDIEMLLWNFKRLSESLQVSEIK